ncbi:MAG TPA: hypothetical protein PKE29_04735 [Phycisphaerales bacterium]|nr:hypothetical protein [Phycisphaerales bacterium]
MLLLVLVTYPIGMAVLAAYGTRAWTPGTCFYCRYSLAGLGESAVCPECGLSPIPNIGPQGTPGRLVWSVLGAAWLIDASTLLAFAERAKEGVWIGLAASTIALSAMVGAAWISTRRIHRSRGWLMLIPAVAAAIGNAAFWIDDLGGSGPYRGISLLVGPIVTTVAGGALFLLCAGIVTLWNRRAILRPSA